MKPETLDYVLPMGDPGTLYAYADTKLVAEIPYAPGTGDFDVEVGGIEDKYHADGTRVRFWCFLGDLREIPGDYRNLMELSSVGLHMTPDFLCAGLSYTELADEE